MLIGNDGSAFVEALVSRSGDDGKNYEVSVFFVFTSTSFSTYVIIYIVGFYFPYMHMLIEGVVGHVQFHVTSREQIMD